MIDFGPMPAETWVRRARPLLDRYADGDTFCFESDLGHYVWLAVMTNAREKEKEPRIRLQAVSAPERYKPGGPEATAFLRAWLLEATTHGPKWSLIVRTELAEAFGRYVAVVWRVSDGRCLNQDLVDAGHAEWDLRS